MQIYYALFDQATDMGGGNYWTWADKELPHELLTRFYNDFAVKHLAPEPNKLGDALWGGMVHLAAESMEQCGWFVLYREFDGGHDRQNRPNRFVILTAWVRTNEVYENIVPVFNNKTFQYVSAHSKELPVPPPPAMLSKKDSETIMRSAFEKFVPFVNPCWDSHLQVENKPTGMDTTESDAFTQELGERFKAERLEKKRIKEELDRKLQLAEELLHIKEAEWNNYKEKLNSILNEKSTIIKEKDAEIKDLRKRTDSYWGLLMGGAIVGVMLSFVLAIVLFLTGDMKLGGGWFGKSFQKILPSKKVERVLVD